MRALSDLVDAKFYFWSNRACGDRLGVGCNDRQQKEQKRLVRADLDPDQACLKHSWAFSFEVAFRVGESTAELLNVAS